MTCQRERAKLWATVLGAAALAAWSLPVRADTVRVRNIRVSEAAGDTAVTIATSARPTFTTWKLEQPARVVVELSGARLGDVQMPLDAGTYAVGMVSASMTEDEGAGPRTRVILTLRQAADYRVESKGSEITVRVVPRVRPTPVPGNDAQAQVQAEALARNAAEQRARAEGQAKAEAEAKLKAEAQAKTQAEALAKAESSAKAEAQARAETEAKARAEAQAKLKAEAAAKDEAQALAKTEAQAKRKAEAQAQAEAQAKLKAEAQAKLEAEARKEAQARAEAQTKLLAQAKAEAEARAQGQRTAEAKLEAAAKDRQAAEANAEQHQRGEAAAKTEAERLRQELAKAHQETAQAQAAANKAAEENQRQKTSLLRAEARMKEAQAEAEKARGRAELAQGEAATAQRRETEQNQALRAAADRVSTRQKTLDSIARRQEEQRIKLAAAERLVAERESAARALEATLASREEESRAARARRDSLANDASLSKKAAAAAALAEAERQRKEAARVATLSQQELAQAVAARKQEETRKDAQSKLRRDEERKLEEAIALRRAEELRLGEARAERGRLDTERKRLADERAQLETTRAALLAEVERLKGAVANAPVPAPAATATPRSPIVPAVPAKLAPIAKMNPETSAAKPTGVRLQGATGNGARPRSITLRPPSRIHSVDFVDEPSRASVIISVDAGAVFAVERLTGRRLSLRIDHSDLAEGLERNLDATEYLGPVKVVSSYRDPFLRGTVRVDVDLAEDVPNRVRVDGSRIYWDFQKARAPSLPAVWVPSVPSPSVLFVPARKVAGFSASRVNGIWVGQAIPPYLVPPGSPTPPAKESSAPAPAAAPATDSARSTGESRIGGQPASVGRTGSLGRKRYSGRRIDLDFKGADIHNILRLLADVGQVNVVVADDVKGDVTIKMRDVPWDQALDVVLRSKALGSVREGNLLRVAPLSLLEKELEAEIARQKQIAEVVPTETRLIGVSYAEASQLQEKARDLITSRGKISVDERTNTLIVSDVPRSLQLIEDLVRNLDTQTSQVTIEARIVEAQTNFARQFGVQWGGTGFADTTHGNPTGLVFPYNVGIGGGADDSAGSINGLVPGPRTGTGLGGNPNFLVNMPVAAGVGTGSAIGLTLGSVAGAFNLNLRLSAMESTGQVRVLSSPRVTTMDNKEARIVQGVSIPVSVVSAMGAQTQFVDAQLSLTVKPHVTNEGTVAMLINVTNNAPNFSNTSANGTPTIDKKETRTTMLVRDGDTAVIGGIYTRTSGVSHSRVPYFSDIPVLGWFFRARRENDNRVEFLVFITPRIVNRSRSVGQ